MRKRNDFAGVPNISDDNLFCCIFHAKPAKLAKVVTYGLCGLRVNSKNIIPNYLIVRGLIEKTMKLLRSFDYAPRILHECAAAMLAEVSEARLREIVAKIAAPRHFFAEFERNQWTETWLAGQFRAAGYATISQGKHQNLVARPPDAPRGRIMLIGGHYDSAQRSPGADDNASAVAAMLACAELLAQYAPNAPVCFVAFNREEDFIIGSADFVKTFLPGSGMEIGVAHILEMVGYCSHAPHSQRAPRGLCVSIPSVGDFLAIVANREAAAHVTPLLQQARAHCAELPVFALQLGGWLDFAVYHLLRSDHVHFWRKRIPACLWTDTAFFRNANYHRPTDTPDTLDYAFLRRVTQLLLAQALAFCGNLR